MTQNAENTPPAKVAASNFCGFPERLKEIMGKQNQRTFAQKIGVTEGTLRAWLSGKSEPGMQNLIALAEEGNTTIDWLATGEGEMRPGATIQAEVNRSSPSTSHGGPEQERSISVEVTRDDKSPQTRAREQSPVVNANLLTEIIAALEENLARRRMRLSPARKALMIQLIYEHYIETGFKEGAINRFLNLVDKTEDE